MKDFSLLYGPVRTWLPVVAMAVLAIVVLLSQSAGSETDCPAGPSSDCAEPLLGDPQLLGNGEGLDVAPAGVSAEADTGSEPSPWDGFEPSSAEVPFVSLQPSPDPMTEAGQDLVRSAGSDEGDDPNRP